MKIAFEPPSDYVPTSKGGGKSKIFMILGGGCLVLLLARFADVPLTWMDVVRALGLMAMLAFALTSLALGFGALYPNYDTENVAEIPTSFGGLLFMMAAVSYLGGVVILEAWPVYLFLNSRFEVGQAEVGVVPLMMGVAGAAVLTGLAIWLPLRAGIRRIKSVDF